MISNKKNELKRRDFIAIVKSLNEKTFWDNETLQLHLNDALKMHMLEIV